MTTVQQNPASLPTDAAGGGAAAGGAAGNGTQVMPDLTLLPYELVITFPAGTPPPGTNATMTDPPRADELAISVLVVCATLATAATVLRTWAKLYCVRRAVVEDYLGLLSFLVYFVCIGAMSLTIREELFFVHRWDMTLGGLERFQFLTQLFTSAQSVMLMLIKSAILWEWIRIFVPRRIHNLFYYLSVFTIFLNVGLQISSLFATNFACAPRIKLFRVWVEGKCIDGQRDLYLTITVLNLVGHLMILLLPQPIIWRLCLSVRRRLGISFTFSLGVLACVAASGRLASVSNIEFDPEIDGAAVDTDVTYDLSVLTMWGIVEMMCLILVFCIPSIPRIFTNKVTILPMRGSTKKISTTSSKHTDTWPLTTRPSGVDRMYRRMGDGADGTGRRRRGDRSETSLPEHHNGILKVVEITTEEESITDAPGDGSFMLRHPWAEP